ncbi:MAG: hypothetical protein ABL886_16905, partial [Rhodoglobus sp.]
TSSHCSALNAQRPVDAAGDPVSPVDRDAALGEARAYDSSCQEPVGHGRVANYLVGESVHRHDMLSVREGWYRGQG